MILSILKEPYMQTKGWPFVTSVLILLFWLWLIPNSEAQSNTHTVCASGCDFALVQSAINSASNGDVIILLDPVHTEGNITINRPITLQGQGTGQTALQAAANPATGVERVLTITTISPATVRDMTIRHGRANEGGGIYVSSSATVTLRRLQISANIADGQQPKGGGLHNRGQATLIDTSIWQNIVEGSGIAWGAGIYNASSGTIWLNNSDVIENHAISLTSHVRGGGVYNDGTFAATTCNIMQNHAWGDSGGNKGIGYYENGGGTLSYCDISDNFNDDDSPSAASGAGLFIFGETELHRSSVRINRASQGAGIRVYWLGSLLTMRESMVWQNVAASNGGGIHVDENAVAYLYDSTVVANEAKTDGGNISLTDGTLVSYGSTVSDGEAGNNGAGIFVDTLSIAKLNNVTIGENRAEGYGGGLYLEDGAFAWLASATITLNEADADMDGSGTGGGIFQGGDTERLLIRNSIVQGNLDRSPIPFIVKAADCDGPLDSAGFNLIGTLGINLANPDDLPCAITSTNNQIGEDAMLSPLLQNGGPTATYALDPNSPAINGGHPAGCTDEAMVLLENDQRGFRRPDRCDIGAFEYEGIQLFDLFIPLIASP